MRVVSLEYRDAHYRMIMGLDATMKRPKTIVCGTKTSSRSVATGGGQPVGQRSAKWGLG